MPPEKTKPAEVKEAPVSTDTAEADRLIVESMRIAMRSMMDGPLRESAEAKAQYHQSKDEQDKLKAWLDIPYPERMRIMIAEQFGSGPRTFRVSIPRAKEQPVLDIPGHSPEEAEGRYRKFCGIRSCDHAIEVLELKGV